MHGSVGLDITRAAGVGTPALSRQRFTRSLYKAWLKASGGDPVNGIPPQFLGVPLAFSFGIGEAY